LTVDAGHRRPSSGRYVIWPDRLEQPVRRRRV